MALKNNKEKELNYSWILTENWNFMRPNIPIIFVYNYYNLLQNGHSMSKFYNRHLVLII